MGTAKMQHDPLLEEKSGLKNLPQKDKTSLEDIYPLSNKKTVQVQHQLRRENFGLRNQVQNLRHEIDKQNNELQSEMQKLQQEDNNKKTEISQLQQEKDDMSNELQKLRLENNKIKVDTQQLRQEDNNKTKEISQLQKEKNETRNEMSQFRQQNNNIKTEMQQLRQEDSNQRNELQQLRQENNKLKVENLHLLESTECSFFIEKGSVNISEEILGKGAWGAVYKGNFYGTDVAVKEYHEIIVSPYNMGMLERETNIASQCRHPNLLQFICATKNHRNHLLIVTELMDKALRTLIEQHGMDELQLQDEEATLMSMDVARGLSYLHSKTPNPIIHRDVSSANVLLSVDKNGLVRRAKISDYGSANFAKACNTANPGAAIYAAPEASKTQHDPKLDVYSYDCLVCEIYICELPNPMKRRRQIARIQIGETKRIVEQCTATSPQERPTMQDVIGCWEKN